MDLGALSKKLEETRAKVSNNSKINWIKPPKEKGVHFTFRILPYTAMGDIGYIQNFHFRIGGNNTYKCLVNEKDIECPLCKVMNKYEFDLIKRHISTGMLSLNVQVMGKDLNTVYAMSVPAYLIEWLNESVKVSGAKDIFDPKLGRDIIMYRKHDKGAFVRQLSLETRPIADTDEEINAILAKTVDFGKVLKKITDEDVSEIESAASAFDKEMYNKVKDTEGTNEDKKESKTLPFTVGTQTTVTGGIQGTGITTTALSKDEEDLPDFNPETPAQKETEVPDKNVPKCFGTFKNLDDATCLACNSLSECMSKSNNAV